MAGDCEKMTGWGIPGTVAAEVAVVVEEGGRPIMVMGVVYAEDGTVCNGC